MAFREVTMLEVKELLRQHQAGISITQIAARLGADRKTVRRYIKEAHSRGLLAVDPSLLTDALIADVISDVRAAPERKAEAGWELCNEHREYIRKHVNNHVRLTKIAKLLVREKEVSVSYWTLRRFAHRELGYGKSKLTVPVLDGEPGSELQVDTGWVVTLRPGADGKRRRLRAFIFTPHLSRYRFVYPVPDETTASAIAACEAAWTFYSGVFRVLVPDNMKAIVLTADALAPRFTPAFLEYSQARGFVIDPARSRRPQDKPRVERCVRDVRDDCFGGENIATLDDARLHAQRWCQGEYGVRVHSTTRRFPKEHFETEEQSCLLAAPTDTYDVPLWCEPKVGRDHLAVVAKSLYTLPSRFIGKSLTARADKSTVRFYDHGALVKTHARVAVGKRSLDVADFPEEKSAYAMRNVTYLAAQAATRGKAIGRFADALLTSDLPWTRMRRVYKLISLAKKFGDERVEQTCALALLAEMHDVRRLERILKIAPQEPAQSTARLGRVIPIGRYVRPAHQYALALASRDAGETGDKKL